VNKNGLQFSNIFQQLAQDIIWRGGRAIYKHYFQLHCQGLEHLPQDRGYLIVANHVSHLDGPAIIAAHSKHLKYVYSLAAKDYFFNRSWKSWFYRYFFNMIPFERKGKFLDCLKICQNAIAQRKYILFFPEGTRSVTGEIQLLKLGLGLLVTQLQVTVVPAYISGTYQALPKGSRFPKKHPIKISFGIPLEFSDYLYQVDKEDRNKIYKEITDQVASAMEDLKNSQS
jgi:1-acyl-sn-glycerol-3-phosphate acyltransferase